MTQLFQTCVLVWKVSCNTKLIGLLFVEQHIIYPGDDGV